MSDFGWLITICVGVSILIAMIARISKTMTEREALARKMQTDAELAKKTDILQLKLAEIEQRRKEEAARDYKEFINRTKIDVLAVEKQGSVNVTWQVKSQKEDSKLFIQIFRTKSAVADYKDARQNGKLVVATEEILGAYFDKDTRRKGGEFHYSAFVSYDGTIISASTSVVSVLSDLKRRVDQLKAQSYILEEETKAEKAKDDYLTQRTKTSKSFMKNVAVEEELAHIEQETGNTLRRSNPYTVFGKRPRKQLTAQKSDYIKKLVFASLSIAKTDVTTKREAHELIGEAFANVKRSKDFVDREERSSAYQNMMDSLQREEFVSKFDIDLMQLLAAVDKDAQDVLAGEITDADYDQID